MSAPDLGDLGHQVPDVLLHLRVGEMVGEGAVGLAVELDDLAAQPAQQLGGEHARDAVARVDHHLEPSRQAHLASDGVAVVLARVARLRACPRPRSKSPERMVASSPWISSSVSGAAPACTIFTPLSETGLWLPVTVAPPSSPQCAVAK